MLTNTPFLLRLNHFGLLPASPCKAICHALFGKFCARAKQSFFAVSLLFAFLFFNLPAMTCQERTLRFEKYGVENGLHIEQIMDILEDRLGFIWLATMDGLVKFDGYNFKVYHHFPDDNSFLPVSNLPGTTGNIDIRYKYKLEGVNEEWIDADPERTATYTNLDAGDYVFRVIACNGDGVWSEESLAIELTIQPPWWATWQAKILYAALILSGLYFAYRFQLNRKLRELQQNLQQHYLSLATAPGADVFPPDEEKSLPPTAPENLGEGAAMENAFVQKIREIVETNLDDARFDLPQLSRQAAMSSSQLHRKLVALTGLSPNRFIRRVRLSKAKILLLESEESVNAIAYDTGFTDPDYFSRLFKQETGLTPTAFKERERHHGLLALFG